jgi:outer membrane protein OmpA-like peptidoglycan-associated protein
LRGITYPTNGSSIDADSEVLLLGFAAWLLRNPKLRVAVEGHTDDAGDAATNKALSERRAATVCAFLTQNGVPAQRLVARGFGEARPRADNSTAEGRAANRRTEFAVIE